MVIFDVQLDNPHLLTHPTVEWRFPIIEQCRRRQMKVFLDIQDQRVKPFVGDQDPVVLVLTLF